MIQILNSGAKMGITKKITNASLNVKMVVLLAKLIIIFAKIAAMGILGTLTTLVPLQLLDSKVQVWLC